MVKIFRLCLKLIQKQGSDSIRGIKFGVIIVAHGHNIEEQPALGESERDIVWDTY